MSLPLGSQTTKPAAATFQRYEMDQINRRLRDAGLREINPNDPTMRERYGL